MRDPDGPWWTISERSLLEALRRVADGEDPDLVYADMYVNSEHENVPGVTDDGEDSEDVRSRSMTEHIVEIERERIAQAIEAMPPETVWAYNGSVVLRADAARIARNGGNNEA